MLSVVVIMMAGRYIKERQIRLMYTISGRKS